MNTPVLSTILMVFALVFLLIAAFWQPQPNPPRVQFGWLGMAFWAAAIIFGGFHL